MSSSRGFTLIELLVVIAIIAVLSVVVILSLNPAELLRQARDSNRISDMATLKSAIGLYLADVTSPFLGTSTICYVGDDIPVTFNTPNSAGSWLATSSCGQWFTGGGGTALVTSTSRGVGSTTASVSGNGWIPVNFSAISSGAPLGQEPVDPVNQPGTCTGPGSLAFKLRPLLQLRGDQHGLQDGDVHGECEVCHGHHRSVVK